MKKYVSVFVSAVLAGICIGLGGAVYLSLKDAFAGGAVVGALLFTVGLFTICTKGFHLFTGQVCALFDNKPAYLLELLTVWIGNFVGGGLVALLFSLTRASALQTAAAGLVAVKMTDSLLSLFVLGLLCNIFIYIAVSGYQKIPHEIGKYLALFLGVAVFILCGTEHSVADMFYWSLSGRVLTDPLGSLLRLLVITAGNAVGGVLFPLLEKAKAKLAE